MRILTFVAHYLPGFKGGGPIKTIRNLVESTNSSGLNFRIVTHDRDLGDAKEFSTVDVGCWNRIGRADVYYVTAGRAGLKKIKNLILNDDGDYDLIYVNSFFSSRFSIYPQLLAFIKNRILVVAPRGEFSHGALQFKSFKKKFYIGLYKLLRLHNRAIFQASSEFEAQDIKRILGRKVDVIIAENIGAREFAKNAFQQHSDEMRIIFISRISKKKNLLQALEILHQVKSRVLFNIYGPIEDEEYWSACEMVIESLPGHIKAEYKGELNPKEVIQTMALHDLFFMPTYGENYGHVITEAFCAGLPVLIADTTPWRQLENQDLGWDFSLSESHKFAETIDKFASMGDDEYQQKRLNILEWAKHKFAQQDTVEANIEMFKYAYKKSRKQ